MSINLIYTSTKYLPLRKAAVLDRILLMIFAATFLFGSAYFYSEIGRHPVPDHPFKSWIGNDNITRDDYTEYRGCNEYHTEHIVAGKGDVRILVLFALQKFCIVQIAHYKESTTQNQSR